MRCWCMAKSCGDGTETVLKKPEPFVPNKIESVSFNVGDIAHTYKKGHRIMVQIQSSWFPLVDRNPQKFVNIYTASENDFQKATIRIYHDMQHKSNVVLPVLNGSPGGI